MKTQLMGIVIALIVTRPAFSRLTRPAQPS